MYRDRVAVTYEAAPRAELVLHERDLTWRDPLVSYKANKSKPLLMLMEMGTIEDELKPGEDFVTEVGKVMLRRMAYQSAMRVYSTQRVFAQEYKRNRPKVKSRVLKLGENMSLERRMSCLVLLEERVLCTEEADPEAILRLDTLLTYKDRSTNYTTVKSGVIDEERSAHIAAGMAHLIKLLEGKHQFMFFAPKGADPDLKELRDRLQYTGVKQISAFELQQDPAEIRSAAEHAIKRYNQLEQVIIPREELRKLRLVS